jgi:hypothetical protein
VRFKVEGTGNLKWVERGPELVVPGAKVFPPQVKSSLQARVDGYAGSKTWEYVVVPETSGALAVPALPFTYFDPGEGKVVNVSSPALELAVEGGVAGGLETARPAPAPRGRSGLALRDSLEGGAVGRRALGPRALLAVLLLAALVHAGLAWSARSGWRAGTHPRGNARAALGHLRRAAEPGLAKEEAAALIEKALKEAFADRNGDDGERSRVVDRLLDEVQQVRYAPQLGDYSERLKDLAQQAREAVQRWA